MNAARNNSLRVALLAEQGERDRVGALLESGAIELVLDQLYDASFPVDLNGAQALLVSVHAQSDRARLEEILRESPIPVLIDAAAASDVKVEPERLLTRLQALVEYSNLEPLGPAQRARPELSLVHVASGDQGMARRVIVLEASVGGPMALARFLRALPSNLPVAFLLAQQISPSSQHLLVQQLDRCSGWRVAVPGNSERAEVGKVWVVPVSTSIEMYGDDRIRARQRPWASVRRPDIDYVLRNVAEVCGVRAGAIMFSGLGDDSARGCVAIKESGGFVWAQDAASCVVANMPEAARRSRVVEFSGTPEKLAQELISRCQLESTSIN